MKKEKVLFYLPKIKERQEIREKFKREGSSQEDLNKAQRELSKARTGYVLNKNKVKIKKIPIHIKKIPATKILKQFAELNYGGVKEVKQYIPANDNRSLFFKEEWKKAQ